MTGGVPILSGGVKSTFTVTSDMLLEHNLETLEHVTITVWISHSKRGDVEVELVSPNGVKSVLAAVRKQDYATTGFKGWRFMTIKHWLVSVFPRNSSLTPTKGVRTQSVTGASEYPISLTRNRTGHSMAGDLCSGVPQSTLPKPRHTSSLPMMQSSHLPKNRSRLKFQSLLLPNHTRSRRRAFRAITTRQKARLTVPPSPGPLRHPA